MASSNRQTPTDGAGKPSNGSVGTASHDPVPEVTPEKAAEIARNLQQVFSRIGQQPIPPRLQEIIDRMAEEERRNE